MRQNVPWAPFCIVAAGLIAGTLSRAVEYAWGAISIDASDSTTSPAYGVGGGDSEKEAVDNAMKFCVKVGGKGCKTMVSYEQCGAFASNGHDAGWGKAPTKGKPRPTRCRLARRAIAR
ncbi:MAG TPA: DUF4189 domain-containing protein [Roseiarcus sp.]|nr:DUF4189 domain-containing protein [Roseiarcus sp.]